MGAARTARMIISPWGLHVSGGLYLCMLQDMPYRSGSSMALSLEMPLSFVVVDLDVRGGQAVRRRSRTACTGRAREMDRRAALPRLCCPSHTLQSKVRAVCVCACVRIE